MCAAQYRESLRAYRPRVFVDGHTVDSVADSTASTQVCKHIGHINCGEPELASA